MRIPILYSEQECPYSIRARFALVYAGIQFELRNIDSGDLPKQILELSNETKVPVLLLADGRVLEKSLEIMHWALLENDPEGWIDYEVDALEEMQGLIRINDNSFANDVIHYVHWAENNKQSREVYRKDCELFLAGLEEHLQNSRFLFDERVSQADYAILPFVYLFEQVGMEWFREALYPQVWQWLDYHKNAKLFKSVMKERPLWVADSKPVIYPVMNASPPS